MKATVRHGLTILLTLAMVVLSVTAQAERKLLDRVVAIVDDEVILQSELDARINTIVGRLSAQGTGLPPRELLEQRVLDQLIQESLQLQMADQMGMRISDNELNETLANIATSLHATLSAQTPAGSATYNAALNEVQIDTGGNRVSEVPSGFLGLTAANSYIDGRLDGKKIVVTEGEGGVLQVGPNNEASNRIAFNIGDMRSSGNELNLTGLSVATLESARNVISRIDAAIHVVSRQRGNLGAVQNRLQFATANLENAIENLTAAESAIRDADVAEEISQFTRAQILTQASTAMIAQANSLPQSALQLLQ